MAFPKPGLPRPRLTRNLAATSCKRKPGYGEEGARRLRHAELTTLLNKTGLGNHPEIIRVFYRPAWRSVRTASWLATTATRPGRATRGVSMPLQHEPVKERFECLRFPPPTRRWPDVAARMAPDGKIDPQIVEMLNETNEILDDVTVIEANGFTEHKTTVRSGLPTGTWRKLNYGVQPEVPHRASQGQHGDAGNLRRSGQGPGRPQRQFRRLAPV